jgi:hypothetical protein
MLHRDLARHSRLQVLCMLGSFAILQLGLALGIEIVWPALRDPYFAYRAERLQMRRTAEAAPPLTVIMFGSSRVQCGFKSSDLEASARGAGKPAVVFNFGIPGVGPIANLLHLRRILKRGVRPDLVFLEVAPIMFNGLRGKPREEIGKVRGARLWRKEIAWLKQYRFPIKELRKDWWSAEMVPCYGQRFNILSRVAPQLLPPALRLDWARHMDDSGWQAPVNTTVSPEDCRRYTEFTLRGHGDILRSFELCESSCRAVHDFLSLCQRQQIPAGIIWMPEGSEYRKLYPRDAVERIEGFLTEVSRQQGVLYINARDWVPDDAFVESNHLLLKGAHIFTERFGREVLLPMLMHDSLQEKFAFKNQKMTQQKSKNSGPDCSPACDALSGAD